jgi:hypothetical protein
MGQSTELPINNKYILRAIINGFYENLLLFVLLYLICLKYNKTKYILLFIGLFLFLNKNLGKITAGISELYGVFFIIYFYIFYFIRINKK